jgi:hypothetical protein
VGHHPVPAAVFSDRRVAPKLSGDAIRLFAGYYTGPTVPPHVFGGQAFTKEQHDAYSARVLEHLVKFIDEHRGYIDDVQAREFADLISQGKGYDGSVDPDIEKFNAKIAAQAEAYQAGIPSRIPEANPSNDALIKRGDECVKGNPRRCKSKLPGFFNGAANCLGGLSIIVGAMADAVENAPRAGLPPGYGIIGQIDEAYVFEDPNGRHIVQTVPQGMLGLSSKYYKVYIDDQGNEIDRVEITESRFRMIEEKSVRLYGRWQFNWSKSRWDWIPGTLRPNPPIILLNHLVT